jgi:type IV pili sensor histidine kinase/response regulator
MFGDPVIDGEKPMVQVGSGTIAFLILVTASTIELPSPEPAAAKWGDQRIGRYQNAVPQPRGDQRDLLSAMVGIELADEVKTVGQAIAAVLEDSGYRLSSNPASCQKKLFELPLPEVHRSLGPLTLRQTLEVLCGPAYELATDPVRRLVSFVLVPTDEPSSLEDSICD